MGGMDVDGRSRVGTARERRNSNGCEETCRGRRWFREGIGNERDGWEGRVGEGSEETEGSRKIREGRISAERGQQGLEREKGKVSVAVLCKHVVWN